MGVVELEHARAAFDRGDWPAAHRAWSEAGLTTLALDELEDCATAAVLVGRHDEAVAALQRAFVGHQDEGRPGQAVRVAFRLAMTSATHGEPALFAGWTSRAESLLDQLDADCAERGWVALLRMFRALGAGDFPSATACADEAAVTGRRHGDRDLVALGLCSRGRLALYTGQVAAGLAMLDESMVRVIAGEAGPIIAGHVYCTAIEGCQEIGDFARMAEWTSALERWCAAQPGLLAFTGQCAVHRGQLMRLRGEWTEALHELALASSRYQQLGARDAIGLAAAEAGDVHRLRGEHDAADEDYQRAADHGFDPQPGLALLWLARGQGAAAFATVERLLAEPGGPVQRCRLLPGVIEVLLGCGELERARAASDELAGVARTIGSSWVEAAAATSAGAVELAGGDPAGAMPYLRKALQLWAGVGGRCEHARTRVLLGRALAALGDEASARRELTAARTVLRGLGAGPAADEVDALLAPEALPAGLTAREVEVLRLVATGRSNAQIAAELVLSGKTVARHLSNIFTKLGVGSRTAAAAFAFEHGLL